MGTELFPDTSKNLHILTRLSARENLIEFCRLRASRLITMYWSLVSFWPMKTQSGLADGPNLHVRCQGQGVFVSSSNPLPLWLDPTLPLENLIGQKLTNDLQRRKKITHLFHNQQKVKTRSWEADAYALGNEISDFLCSPNIRYFFPIATTGLHHKLSTIRPTFPFMAHFNTFSNYVHFSQAIISL